MNAAITVSHNDGTRNSLTNTALTGATYDVDGGQQLVAAQPRKSTGVCKNLDSDLANESRRKYGNSACVCEQ